jgi:general secretion pathway protein D
LIEAKVVEITLSDQYRAGVDWDAVFGPAGQALTVGTNFSRNVVPPNFSNPTLIANWNNSDQDLSLAVQMVKEFGAVRTLSSPRLTALNNQVAQLKVAQNQVFFELDVTFTEATTKSAQREWSQHRDSSPNPRWAQVVVTSPTYYEFDKVVLPELCPGD